MTSGDDLSRVQRYLQRVCLERGRRSFVFIVTAASVWLSLVITSVSMTVTPSTTEMYVVGLAIALVVPLMVAPLAASSIARLFLALDVAHRDLRRVASRDPLTEVSNRRAFVEEAGDVVAGGRHIVVAMIDVDDFKAVNDRFGHHTGDHVLRTLAMQLCEALEGNDTGLVGRLGGDEFAVAAVVSDAASAAALHARLLQAARLDSIVPGSRASVGSVHGTDFATVEDALIAADHALYERKRSLAAVAADTDPERAELQASSLDVAPVPMVP